MMLSVSVVSRIVVLMTINDVDAYDDDDDDGITTGWSSLPSSSSSVFFSSAESDFSLWYQLRSIYLINKLNLIFVRIVLVR